MEILWQVIFFNASYRQQENVDSINLSEEIYSLINQNQTKPY